MYEIVAIKVEVHGVLYDVPATARMSANVEEKKVDTTEKVEEKPKKPLREKLKEQWNLILKCVELVRKKLIFLLDFVSFFLQLLCVACVGVVYDPFSQIGIGKEHLSHVAVMYTAFTGYILILLIMIASRLMNDKIPYKINTIFSILAAILFFISGVLIAKDKSDRTNTLFHAQFYLLQMLIATSAFCFLNCAIFIVDASLTYWKKIDF